MLPALWFVVCVVLVDSVWGEVQSTPKMRQFRQFMPSLEIWGNNKFFDGIIPEKQHRVGKNYQKNHNNNQNLYKRSVTQAAQDDLAFKYALNGGRWGPNFEYHVGRLVNKIRDPQNPQLPNLILTDFMFPSSMNDSSIVQVNKYLPKNHEPHSEQQLKQLLKGKKNQTRRTELETYINAGACWTNKTIELSHIQKSKHWKIRKIVSFTFHLHSQSFKMAFDDNEKCLMKTNNHRIFQFKHAYSFQYKQKDEILIAFGTFWHIKQSRRGSRWINDKFASMDSINHNERHCGWFFMTNLVEPVFLLHACVNLEDVYDSLPDSTKCDDLDIPDWKNLIQTNPNQFHQRLTMNLHKLITAKKTYKLELQHMEIPCGPIYKCRKCGKSDCSDCIRSDPHYGDEMWQLCWQCNLSVDPNFWIFDEKNGLLMTLMETVCRDNKMCYE